MTKWRTDWVAFQLDLLDFIAEKVDEARKDREFQLGAITEAAGAIPLLKERLLAPEHACQWAQVLLIANGKIEGLGWWDNLARADREVFLKDAEKLIAEDGFIPTMRKIVASGS